jgi:3-dehydroquinate synthase
LERVRVEVPDNDYEVTIAAGALDRAAELLPALAGAERAFVIADAEVAGRYLEPLVRGLAERGWSSVHLGVPRGEEAKSLQTMTALQRQLATQEAHRDDVVIALGGGAVGDLAGFVAATYMRGVPFVQAPTTLTAQVDAAIGGKTAENLPDGKNLVGAFHQPVAVIADVATLATLPERDYRSGLAEVAKYALTLDLELLDQLERDPAPVLARDTATLEPLVARCVRAKAAVVAEDERDVGRRLILNYGHTLGHALERIDAFTGRSHGEAIAVGMVFAARLAELLDRAADGLVARHVRLLSALGLDGSDVALPTADEILAAMRMDKKYSEGVRFIVLEDVGRPSLVDDVPDATIREALTAVGVPR